MMYGFSDTDLATVDVFQRQTQYADERRLSAEMPSDARHSWHLRLAIAVGSGKSGKL